ncbi:MAG TPA: hypothetical protein VFN41_08610 [Candidatus Limnocylindrales bacterium]|nr:hypothetical protein [Candidatus Limnocylindrales bacterium]
MRLVYVLCTLPIVAILAIILATNVLAPEPAAQRLAGVSVSVIGYVIDDLPDDKHRLRLTVNLSSPTDIDQCVGFTLDEPFGGRRLEPLDGQCPRPRAGTEKIGLTFDKLTSDDLTFPEHIVVWGVPGGRCGIVLEAFGVCVVEQAGTVDLKLPSRNPLPTIGPIGTFAPIVPLYSFSP